jgi:hypothetical protein
LLDGETFTIFEALDFVDASCMYILGAEVGGLEVILATGHSLSEFFRT